MEYLADDEAVDTDIVCGCVVVLPRYGSVEMCARTVDGRRRGVFVIGYSGLPKTSLSGVRSIKMVASEGYY